MHTATDTLLTDPSHIVSLVYRGWVEYAAGDARGDATLAVGVAIMLGFVKHLHGVQ